MMRNINVLAFGWINQKERKKNAIIRTMKVEKKKYQITNIIHTCGV